MTSLLKINAGGDRIVQKNPEKRLHSPDFIRQKRCKPGYVPPKWRCLSFIYSARSPAGSSSLPPGNGRAILSCRYIWHCNPWDVRHLVSPRNPVGSYPAFSPLPPKGGGYFLSLIPGVAAGFPLGNMVPYVARTFLLKHYSSSDRPLFCMFYVECHMFYVLCCMVCDLWSRIILKLSTLNSQPSQLLSL